MSFKENLLKKIEIDKMAEQVIASMGPPDSGRKIDKKIMRSLLETTDYTYKRKRDLDLYIEDVDAEKTRILVLDNDLAVYNTSIYDVAMRKSPTVKEMMNPYNIIKILKDTDVVMSKKAVSVSTIQKECIAKLNLFFDASDIDEIAKEGLASLGKEYTDGVIESLDLFAEILNYSVAPKAFRIRHNKIVGALTQKESGEDLFGPMVLYSMIHNTLKLIDEQIGGFDKGKIEFFQQVAGGMQKASAEGPDVFQYLKAAALKRIPTPQNPKEEA
ncbi:MAG TPA: hypothetical protein VMW06_06200 [Desulfobacterales bacterium]|nr:hypothetical protein [Desulfobacterales bacterium]